MNIGNIGGANMVQITAQEFSAKYQSKKEVSIQALSFLFLYSYSNLASGQKRN